MILFRRPQVRIVKHATLVPERDVPHPALAMFECEVDGVRGWHALVFRECDGGLGVWLCERPRHALPADVIEGYVAQKVKRAVRRTLRGGS